MALEDPHTIDIISTSKEGKKTLVLTDAGVTTEPDTRNALLREKLKTYLEAILSGQLSRGSSAVSPEDYEICVVCMLPPTEEMLSIRAVCPRGDKDTVIPVEFELFGSRNAEPQRVERAAEDVVHPVEFEIFGGDNAESQRAIEPPEISEDLASTIDFALAMGLDALKGGSEAAHAVTLGPGGATVVVLAGFEDTREAARRYAADLGPEVKAFAVCFEGEFSTGSQMARAAIVEASERGLGQGVAFGQRFQPKGFLKKFRSEGEKVFLAHCAPYLA